MSSLSIDNLPLPKRVWALTKPYWKSEERWVALGLLAVIVTLNLTEVYITVLLNKWNNDFYNSLQKVDKKAFFEALFRFSYLAFFFIAVAVYRIYLNQMLRIKWRRWMITDYLSNWLNQQNYYRMQLLGNPADNPDQRIAEDVEQFINLTLGLSLGLLSSLVSLFSFLTILWGLSGALEFTLAGMDIHIPGYMFWAALLYAAVGTWLTMRIGRPLIRLNFDQQRYEADFRFSLVRLRENTESIAFYQGEAREQVHFGRRLDFVVDNFWQIMKRQKMLTWFTSGYNQLATIFPFVVSAPRFFAGTIQLGGLMQTVSAFNRVQDALSYLIDSYSSIAAWKAVIDRLTGFHQSLDTARKLQQPAENFTCETTPQKSLVAAGLTIRLPSGNLLLEKIDLTLKPGDSLLITGESGSGKSTLLRTLAGLWPFAEGRLLLPEQASMLFVPQKPYLPLGSLREALCYPHSPESISEGALREALRLCHLEHLNTQLDQEGLWSHILSLGEQQRVAFARILLTKPDFLFLDEATSALDEATEAQLYALLKERLPQAALISIGHRHTLRAWHQQEKKLA